MTTVPDSVALDKPREAHTPDPAAYRFWMIGHGHIDPVWRWTWDEGYQEVFATFRSVLDRMNEFPEVCFVASSPQMYAWVEENDPAMFEEIRARVQEGRWSLVGGWWIEPDANLPLGESLARLGLHGQRYFQEKFGRRATIGFNPDTFGHPWTLPQILRQHGLDSYFFMRPMLHEKPGLPTPIFHWEGVDGSRILTVQIISSYNCAEMRDAEDDKLDPRLRDYIERFNRDQPEIRDMPVFYGMGNHGGGPTIASLRAIERARKTYPSIRHGSLEDFREALRPHEDDLAIVNDELLHHARGCYSACCEVKLWNRRAEISLLRAEKLAATATILTGRDYPAGDLREAWKKVLFNQFHDIIAGSSIEAAYQDARDDYGYAMSVAKAVATRSLQALAQDVATAQGDPGSNTPFLIFNSHPWPVRDAIEIEMERPPAHKAAPIVLNEKGEAVACQEIRTDAPDVGNRVKVTFQAELPAMGYALFRLDFTGTRTAPAAGSCRATATTLENNLLRATFDPRTGTLKSLWDKKEGREILAGPSASLIVLEDTGDTWGHDIVSYDQELGRFDCAEIVVRETGPERASLEITSSYGRSRIVQEFFLHHDSPALQVRLTADWQEKQKVLKLGFATVLKDGEVTASIPNGAIPRSADGTESPMQTWVDLSGRDAQGAFGLTFFSESLGAYSAMAGELRPTLLHSTIWSDHGPEGPRRNGYRYMDQGERSFRYAISVHSGTWNEAHVAGEAEVFLTRPVTHLANHHAGKLPATSSLAAVILANVAVPAWKLAENGQGWIIRCLELEGRASATVLQLPASQQKVPLEFRPAEIKTLFVPINGGVIRETNLLED